MPILIADLVVCKTTRAHNTNSKDNIIKNLGDYCRSLNQLDETSKVDILNVIRKLDDNYYSNWSLFGKKIHTESTIIAWVLIFSYFQKQKPSNLYELNQFIKDNFKTEKFSDLNEVDDRFAWGRNSNQRYFDNICSYLDDDYLYSKDINKTNNKKHDYVNLINSFNLKNKINNNFDSGLSISKRNLSENSKGINGDTSDEQQLVPTNERKTKKTFHNSFFTTKLRIKNNMMSTITVKDKKIVSFINNTINYINPETGEQISLVQAIQRITHETNFDQLVIEWLVNPTDNKRFLRFQYFNSNDSNSATLAIEPQHLLIASMGINTLMPSSNANSVLKQDLCNIAVEYIKQIVDSGIKQLTSSEFEGGDKDNSNEKILFALPSKEVPTTTIETTCDTGHGTKETRLEIQEQKNRSMLNLNLLKNQLIKLDIEQVPTILQAMQNEFEEIYQIAEKYIKLEESINNIQQELLLLNSRKKLQNSAKNNNDSIIKRGVLKPVSAQKVDKQILLVASSSKEIPATIAISKIQEQKNLLMPTFNLLKNKLTEDNIQAKEISNACQKFEDCCKNLYDLIDQMENDM